MRNRQQLRSSKPKNCNAATETTMSVEESVFDLAIPHASACGAWATVVSAYHREPIGRVALADAAAVEQALANAHAIYRNRDAWLPIPKRIAVLEGAIAALKADAEFYATEAAREGGKPLVDSRVEVARAIDSLKLCIDTLRTEAGEVIPMRLGASSANRMACTQLEPIGVVLAISAFNHPLNLIAHQVGPAIAAGCPVIVKPAKATPLSCFRLVELLRKAGLPDGYCQPLLPLDNQLTSRMVADARVAFLSFIGSAAVGWKLKGSLAPGARAALEHGGVAPVIVAEDADLNTAVPLLAKGGFYHAGQVCVSVQRIFAHASIAEQLARAIAEAGQKMLVGNPTSETTEIGPLIHPDETRRVHEWVREAVEQGAQCLSGGAPISEVEYPATVLLNPPEQAKVSQKEVFGPVVCVYSYTDLDEAIARANALEFAFQASVFTQSIDLALRCYQRLDASAVMVNDHTAFRVDWMPFAGLKQSGYGVGGIAHSLREMQVRKMLVLRSAEL